MPHELRAEKTARQRRKHRASHWQRRRELEAFSISDHVVLELANRVVDSVGKYAVVSLCDRSVDFCVNVWGHCENSDASEAGTGVSKEQAVGATPGKNEESLPTPGKNEESLRTEVRSSSEPVVM